MRIGVLTSGGDCPGLNAVLRAIARKADRCYDDEILGFLDAWRGVLDDEWMPLTVDACRGLLPRGGTIIGTSRIQPYMYDDGVARVRATMERHRLDGFIVVGGNGSLSAAAELTRDGIPCVGVPKTIDNDIVGTDSSFGFDTALNIATEAIDRLHTTAEAHDRIIVCEVMGRDVGHIAVGAGMAGGATMTLIPEVPFDVGEVCDALARRHHGGRFASIVVVAEGAAPKEGTFDLPEYEVDRFGHRRLGGIANVLAGEIERRTGIETRVTILGHVQRGGKPTARDRVLSTRFGVAALDACHDAAWGQMVALEGEDVARRSLDEVAGKLKMVPAGLYDQARWFFAG